MEKEKNNKTIKLYHCCIYLGNITPHMLTDSGQSVATLCRSNRHIWSLILQEERGKRVQPIQLCQQLPIKVRQSHLVLREVNRNVQLSHSQLVKWCHVFLALLQTICIRWWCKVCVGGAGVANSGMTARQRWSRWYPGSEQHPLSPFTHLLSGAASPCVETYMGWSYG